MLSHLFLDSFTRKPKIIQNIGINVNELISEELRGWSTAWVNFKDFFLLFSLCIIGCSFFF